MEEIGNGGENVQKRKMDVEKEVTEIKDVKEHENPKRELEVERDNDTRNKEKKDVDSGEGKGWKKSKG